MLEPCHCVTEGMQNIISIEQNVHLPLYLKSQALFTTDGPNYEK